MNSYIKYWNKRWRPKPQLSFSARRAKRHPYTGSKRFDRSCRNHGACGYCAGGRQHTKARQTPIAEWELVGSEDIWHSYDDYHDWEDNPWEDRHSYDDYHDWAYCPWEDDPWDMWDPHGIEDWHSHELDGPDAEWEDYHNYFNYIDWEAPNSWWWEFNGLEDDHIMEIINNRLNTSEGV